MPTMRDVARTAEVSIATVSHVINNTRPVSDELRDRVYAAMEALSYQRNAVARALRSKQSLTIGVIVPDSTNPFFAEVTRGIEDVSLAHEYSVILCDTRGELANEILHTRNLAAKQVDGIIYIAAGKGYKHIAQVAQQIPVVLVERDPLDMNVGAVLISNLDGGRLATEHLLALGHRRIACITGPSRLTLREDRIAGYRQALQAAGLALDESLIAGGQFSCESGYEEGQRLLALPERPSAIFAFNDLMALGVLHAAREAGLHVPEDLSVVGFDNIHISAFSVPALTTVSLPRQQMGAQAAQLLLERIDNTNQPAPRVQVPIELVVRASTAPYPA